GVSVDGAAGRAISSELAALGLRVTTKRADVGIGGEVRAEPLGEAVAGTKVFSAGASADLSVNDAKSEMILPSVGVSLPQPIAAVSQDQASARAVGAVCRLWIERNVPLIAAALLEPGEPVEICIPSSTDRAPGIAVVSDWSSGSSPQVVLVPAQGPRLILEPDALTPLALKLKNAVTAKYESRPVGIAVARFKGIGISDPAAVEDILEDLSTALVKTGVFQLVERSRLDEVLRELRIQNSGLVDSSTAKKLGKLVGARAVLVGSISDRKDCYVINARIIDTESGLVGIAESIVIDKAPEPVILRAGPRR
ncbi:MAG: FlgO family outer membrane protein, partial [Armatimonadetes bacterium]|nr:FlgO family outer membrane protein [Armatimonadota bacterium]